MAWAGAPFEDAALRASLSPGPPGPPEAVTIDEITDSTAQLSWRPGPDNHSPVTMYIIQARTPFSVGWQAVSTGTGWGRLSQSSAQGEGRRVDPGSCLQRHGRVRSSATALSLSSCFLCADPKPCPRFPLQQYLGKDAPAVLRLAFSVHTWENALGTQTERSVCVSPVRPSCPVLPGHRRGGFVSCPREARTWLLP